jgi:DNA-binding MarR family transcriptional regulator
MATFTADEGMPVLEAAEPLSPAAVEAGSRAASALYRYMRTTAAAARKAGLQPDQYLMLLAIAGSGAGGWRRSGELAAELTCTRRDIVRLIRLSEAAGLVEVVPEPFDRQNLRVQFTDAGRRTVGQLAAVDRAALLTVAVPFAMLP